MSIFTGLIREVRQLKHELIDILQFQEQVKEGFKTMATKLDEIKAKITEIGNDITEIDADLQEVIDKINSTPGDGLTGAETDEVLARLGDMKTRTRAAADKVSEPLPEPLVP